LVHVEVFGSGQTMTGKRRRPPRYPAGTEHKSEQGASGKVIGVPKRTIRGSNSLSRKG